MQIVCDTPQAAAQVLYILYRARLQPVRDFRMQPVLSTAPPLVFTTLVRLPLRQVSKLCRVPGTTIGE